MKTLLLSMLLILSGCGVNITQKSESSEPPTKISSMKVHFFQNNKMLYKIEKTGLKSNYGPEGVKISEQDKLDTEKTVGIFLKSLTENVETELTGRLGKRGVQVGEKYVLRIFVDEIVVSIQGDNARIKVAPRMNIKYSAMLQRTSDLSPLWTASFRRPNGSTSSEELQQTGSEIAEKIFADFSKSGWIN